MAERMIQAGGVEICTEAFGDPADPAVLLVSGMSASMLWWEEGFCRLLEAGGRFAIRYDHRDTGRSVAYEPGRPEYTSDELVDDAAGVLDAYGIAAAHVVGVSMGGALAQLLALDFPDRVRSLVLISTSFATRTDRALPPSSERLRRFLATAQADPSDPAAAVDHLVEYLRVLAGDRRPFDEARTRALARREVERARDFAASENHGLVPDGPRTRPPVSAIGAPTLVIHGTEDPLFPIEHGEALADEIPGARLLVLDGAGHGLDRADWDTVAAAILEHTAPVR